MGNDDNKIHNPVEEYMRYIMDKDKPDKPLETTAEPTKHLEVKKAADSRNVEGGSRHDALKVADAIEQSINIKKMESAQAKTAPPQLQVSEIKHHPVGLILIFLVVITSYAIAFSVVSFLLPGIAGLIGSDLNTVGPITGIIMLLTLIFGIIFLLFTIRKFLLNRVILTSLNIVEVSHLGLSGKKVRELPMTDIEDVLVEKAGLFPSLFNYGTIIVKTPYGLDDLIFRYAPDPETFAKAIDDSKLEYLAGHRTVSL